MMALIFFNLLVNSIFSLMTGLILVYFFIWLFQVETGRWKIFLLSLPIIKLVFDFARGVPEQSVLFSGVDPFSLPPKHQILSIGAGFDGWSPHVSNVLSVNDLGGKIYHSSVGDYFVIWIQRTFGGDAPLLVVFLVLAISFFLLTFRVNQYFRFEKKRREERAALSPLKTLEAGTRSVDIYISPSFSGTPFTGGIFEPYICLPEDAVKKLSPEELNAVIAHEMEHVRYYDLVVTVLIRGVGDLFWFVPGYRWLIRKIDRLREVAADSWALSSETESYFLASALLKLKELPEGGEHLVLYSAFFREKALLRERIERLIGQVKEERPRFGWQNRWLRFVLLFFISAVIFNSVFGGNFQKVAVVKLPEWLENSLKVSCICVSQKFYVQA